MTDIETPLELLDSLGLDEVEKQYVHDMATRHFGIAVETHASVSKQCGASATCIAAIFAVALSMAQSGVE